VLAADGMRAEAPAFGISCEAGMMSYLTIGIVNFNGLRVLPSCIDSVLQQRGIAREIIVLDNASTDRSRDWLMSAEGIDRIIMGGENLGFARAHNEIIRHMRGDYYFCLNPDVILADHFLERLITEAEVSKDAGWFCGKLLNLVDDMHAEDQIYSTGHAMRRDGFVFNIGAGEKDDGKFDKSREVFGANAAAALYRKEMLIDLEQSTGEIFDDSMFLYYEDADLDWRARLLGWKCRYVPDAVAWHMGDYTGAGGDSRLSSQGIANRYKSMLKNAFLVDLLSCNIPGFILHCLFRSLSWRGRGLPIAISVLVNLPKILEKRSMIMRYRRIDRHEMLKWFEWAKAQPGYERSGLSYRLRNYFARPDRQHPIL